MTTPATSAPAATEPVPLAYRPNQAAKVLGISRSHLYDLVAAGRIRTRKVSPQVTLIERAELERYLTIQHLA